LKVIITLKGKSWQILQRLDALCREKGNIRIEELGREDGTTEVKDETLTAENVQVKLKTLYIALHGHGLLRDLARQQIVWAVEEGLDSEGKAKLEEEEER
jgi:hypothetical protein